MGFLDGSTNNIILDSVLTNEGRRALANGTFSITKFAVGDNGEIDYGIIKRFGRTVGSEKIQKASPVFEASTNAEHALKYKLISVSNPNLIRLPNLSLTGEGLTSDVLSMGKTTTRRRTITISQTIQNEDSIDVELRDQLFVITMNNLFLQVSGESPDNIDGNNIATYLIGRDSGTTSLGGSKLTINFEVKNIPNSLFTTFGNSNNKNLIRTFIKISGLSSGAVKEMEAQISKTT